jgi:hypothetical protein
MLGCQQVSPHLLVFLGAQLANGAIKPISLDHTKRLGLIRQPRSRSILPVDGVS